MGAWEKGRSPDRDGVFPTPVRKSEQREATPGPADPKGKGAWRTARRKGRGARPTKGGFPELGSLYALGGAQGVCPEVGARMDVVVDSGASTCAAPRSVVGAGVPSAPRRSYRTACGRDLAPEGTARVALRCAGGRRLSTKFQVMDVARPLASVSQMVEKGAWVVFRPEGEGGSYLWTPNGASERLFCRDGVYVLPCWIDRGPGFTGRPRGA